MFGWVFEDGPLDLWLGRDFARNGDSKALDLLIGFEGVTSLTINLKVVDTEDLVNLQIASCRSRRPATLAIPSPRARSDLHRSFSAFLARFGQASIRSR